MTKDVQLVELDFRPPESRLSAAEPDDMELTCIGE